MNLKTLTCLLALSTCIYACHSRSGTTTNSVTLNDSVLQKLQVAYTGKFNKGLVSLVINYISGNTVSGYDVHAGQRRNLNGQLTQQGKLLSFVLHEPGGNPGDGTFHFVLDPDSMKLVGKWIPFDSTKASAHKITLSPGKVELQYQDVWGGVASDDTILTFKTNGTCVFEFYPHARVEAVDSSSKAGDSALAHAAANPTDQLISIRGNYTKEGLSYKIEWEKNAYIPTHMTLTKELKSIKGDDGTTEVYPVSLKGDGFTFARTGEEDGD